MCMLNKIKEIIETNSSEEILYKKWDTHHRDEYFSKIYWSYFPITKKYFFEANPSFFYEYKGLFDLGRYPITLLRDGFLGILDFFLLHPQPPKDYVSIILIPKKFEKLIPKQWANQVAVYEVIGINVNEKAKENLIFHGLGVEENFWNESVESKLIKLKEISDEYQNVICLFPQRESMFSTREENEKNYALQLIKNTYKNFGFEANLIMDINKFIEDFKFKNFTFKSLDGDNLFVCDNYLDHFFFQQNGVRLNESRIENKEEKLTYKLSLNHQIEITKYNSEESVFSDFFVNHKILKRTTSIYELFKYPEVKENYLKHFSKL